ncbi:HEAT repeat domain-containing protein [Chloroflexota bacterium]
MAWAKNRYGHPHIETKNTLSARVIVTYGTDKMGQYDRLLASCVKRTRVKMKDTEELIKDLKLKDSSVRRHAIEMLGIMGDEKAVEALILALKDKNIFVRHTLM